MKLTLIVLLLSGLLTGCGDNTVVESSPNNDIGTQHEATSTSLLPADTIYQQPTDLGATTNEQNAKLIQLQSIKMPSPTQQRLIALLKLALFSSDSKQSLEKLITITSTLEQLSNKTPTDYELMAAYGSALSYQSIFMQDDLGRMNLTARKGMRIMDRAIKKAPANLGARFLRGVSYANMPSFLNRASFSIDDLQLLKQHTNAQPQSQFMALVDYYLALAYSRNNQMPQAKALWTSLSNQPNTQWKTLAIAKLKEID
ncbi:MAG: hypothetical protein BM565_03315 [Gammaproteobacteria bacterium MedPE]|nr:MAG: hypothetical protein BM565_03315 [Gammaproteobacteria bacterium MedPE]